jgi:riboflavin synthase
MFTGIITERGSVVRIDRSHEVVGLTVDAAATAPDLAIGDSISVNGVCLTVVESTDRTFSVDVVPESLDRSSLGALGVGDPVNLERPMAANGRFDGHIVQGHVDGVGTMLSKEDEGGSVRVMVSLPPGLARYVVEKGSISVDGTSLTVAGVSEPGAADPWFTFVLIPHTLEVTVFSTKGPGSPVNLEVDVLAKYVERMLGSRS